METLLSRCLYDTFLQIEKESRVMLITLACQFTPNAIPILELDFHFNYFFTIFDTHFTYACASQVRNKILIAILNSFHFAV